MDAHRLIRHILVPPCRRGDEKTVGQGGMGCDGLTFCCFCWVGPSSWRKSQKTQFQEFWWEANSMLLQGTRYSLVTWKGKEAFYWIPSETIPATVNRLTPKRQLEKMPSSNKKHLPLFHPNMLMRPLRFRTLCVFFCLFPSFLIEPFIEPLAHGRNNLALPSNWKPQPCQESCTDFGDPGCLWSQLLVIQYLASHGDDLSGPKISVFHGGCQRLRIFFWCWKIPSLMMFPEKNTPHPNEREEKLH